MDRQTDRLEKITTQARQQNISTRIRKLDRVIFGKFHNVWNTICYIWVCWPFFCFGFVFQFNFHCLPAGFGEIWRLGSVCLFCSFWFCLECIVSFVRCWFFPSFCLWFVVVEVVLLIFISVHSFLFAAVTERIRKLRDKSWSHLLGDEVTTDTHTYVHTHTPARTHTHAHAYTHT